MVQNRVALAGCAAAAIAAAAGVAGARPEIGPGAFTAGATLIDFDAMVGAPNLSTGELLGAQFAPLGVVFSNTFGPSRANTSLAALFATNSDPNIIWADQGGGALPAGTQHSQVMTFSVAVNRVGMFFGTSSGATITMRVYGAGGVLLETLTKAGAPLGGFGLEGFVGIERPETITEVRVSSTSTNPAFGPFNFEFDDLRFESAGATCYADCNGDGVLTIPDFGCFQTAFVQGTMYADCDSSGTLTIADFGCFQTRFVQGCP